MATYSYRARDLNGLLIMGQMEGDSPEPVKLKLAEQGLIPLTVVKGGGVLSQGLIQSLFRRVNPEEIMLFTRQFHTLFKAGMDMETLLSTLAHQTRNKFFSDTISRVKSDVAAGSSLSTAFSRHPKVFNELYTSMLSAGEEAGILDEVLGQLSDLLEKEITLKASVKSAMLYPKIVIFVLIAATTVLMTFVVPKFTSFYANYGAELPLPTRIIIGMSNLITGYWYILGGIALAATFAFKKWYSTAKGRLLVDKFKWKIPVFGMLGQKVANARFSNILGSLYKSGLPITRGLAITAKIIQNEAFARDVMIVQKEVEKGKGIADAMRQGIYFNPLLIEATAIGEKSGAIDEMYASVGSHYDMEVQHTLKNLTTLIEPILLFCVFGLIALFALAVFLPMWNLSRVVM